VGLSAGGGGVMGLCSIIMGLSSLRYLGILMTTFYYPIRKTGRQASCQVTVPGLAKRYHVVVSEDSK